MSIAYMSERVHAADHPLSQKVKPSVPVRLCQLEKPLAPSHRFAVATNFLRVTRVQLSPLKSPKYLFHVALTNEKLFANFADGFLFFM